MPLRPIPNNPFLVDLIPPFKKQSMAVYGTICWVIAILLIFLVLFGAFSFRDPLISIIVALIVFVYFSNTFHL
ncbi:MAG: hypothetical protein QF632_06965 [Candidatus Woesearchaeota archaeon]|jgi:site-specific recombinase|nr:hypothetical protein [Candidatus Woesearchaeota archaeon]MDP7457709.1 hypothetical protein [Candidatus Woesearchaeota archaeon]